MRLIAKGLCAALLFLLGFATPAAAQICSDGEILLISNHLRNSEGTNPTGKTSELPFNSGGNGPNMASYYDQIAASDGFSDGGAFSGYRPVMYTAALVEFADLMMNRGMWCLEYRDGVQILRCASARKLSPTSWQGYCGLSRLSASTYVSASARNLAKGATRSHAKRAMRAGSRSWWLGN